jgi:tetratricopeptide (TPR) repeat protein
MNPNWRKFKFFEPEVVRSAALEEVEITAATCGRNHVYLGDALGMVKVVERSSMNIQWSFAAYTGIVTHMRMPRSIRSILITIGDDGGDDVSIVRVWDLEHRRGTDSSAGDGNVPVVSLRPSREVRLFSAKHPSPLPKPLRFNYNTDMKIVFRGGAANLDGAELGHAGSLASAVVCFDVTEDVQQLAVALTDDRILVVRGDLDRDRAPVKVSTLTSRHPGGCLSFVGFPKLSDPPTTGGQPVANPAFHTLLYAVYEDVTVAFPLPPRNRDITTVDDRPFEIPSRVGAKRECAAISEDGELVVASEDGVTYYGGDQFVREKRVRWDGTFAANDAPIPSIKEEKCKLAIHKHYLVVLTRADGARKPDKFSLNIYDRESRICAVSSTSSSLTNVSWVLPDISDILVVSYDSRTDQTKNKMVKFLEISTQAKFDLLFKKDMYEEAKKIVKQIASAGGGKIDPSTYNIERRYGDHLYEKGKYDEAVAQYIEAIRTTEPSYVIRKFLGEQRISNLTAYLEALHRKEHGRLANKNHTTLLLNCYAKLKAEDKMNAFIRREDITFDAVNAIHVCRQAGSSDAATFLADKYKKPDEYVAILLEDQGKYEDALRFTSRQNLKDAERILQQHAKALLTHLPPPETTAVLIRLCTQWTGGQDTGAGSATARNAAASPMAAKAAGSATSARPEPFMPAFVDTPRALLQFLEAVVLQTYRRSTSGAMQAGSPYGQSSEVLGTLLELYLTPVLPDRVQHKAGADAVGIAHGSPDRTLGAATPEQKADAEERRRKALELLQAYPGQYDAYHALMLVQQHGYEKGITYMLKELHLHAEIFNYYAKQFSTANELDERKRAKQELLRTCEEATGESSKDMWISYLSLLVQSRDEVHEDITSVLERIERDDLLPPVAVIEILSASKTLELRAVRNYIVKMINRDRATIDACQREIDEMQDEAKKLHSTVTNLQTSAQVFQTAKCHQCDDPLEKTSVVVYFLCGHSFHETCLSERDCNICGHAQRQHLQAQKDFEAAAEKHEYFFDRLREQKDGFSVVAEHFGRGIFSVVKRKAEKSADEFDMDDDDDDLYNADPQTTNDLEGW